MAMVARERLHPVSPVEGTEETPLPNVRVGGFRSSTVPSKRLD